MSYLLTVIKRQLIKIGPAFLENSIFLTRWIFRKITRRPAGISFNTALVLLLAAILLIPFAMNYTAHLMSRILNN